MKIANDAKTALLPAVPELQTSGDSPVSKFVFKGGVRISFSNILYTLKAVG
jgi:hypothetical protein